MGHLRLHFLSVGLTCCALSGCSGADGTREGWYSKCSWDAKAYFESPVDIELCEAIQRNDRASVVAALEAGANINACGRSNMTPLIWAYPYWDGELLPLLIEHGAKADVAVQDELNTRGVIKAGDSAATLAARARGDMLKHVLQSGVDPNTVNAKGDSLLHLVLKGAGPNKRERLDWLIEHGADLNQYGANGGTPAMTAVAWMQQYDLALHLLKAGADPMAYRKASNHRLIHSVIDEASLPEAIVNRQSFKDLRTYLLKHDRFPDAAAAELKKWKQEIRTMSAVEFGLRRRKEFEERKRREAEAAVEESGSDDEG
jgi:ankyrin repeat protein